MILAIADGDGRILVTHGEDQIEVPVTVRDAGVLPEFNFERDVIPILSRYGCNSSGCHGKAEGQNGFKLSVFGFDPSADLVELKSENRGRRISLTQPELSLLLRKSCGDVPHGGGVRIPRDSVEYGVLRNWIAAGAPAACPLMPGRIAVRDVGSSRRNRGSHGRSRLSWAGIQKLSNTRWTAG